VCVDGACFTKPINNKYNGLREEDKTTGKLKFINVNLAENENGLIVIGKKKKITSF
jgi:hypothetical protein